MITTGGSIVNNRLIGNMCGLLCLAIFIIQCSGLKLDKGTMDTRNITETADPESDLTGNRTLSREGLDGVRDLDRINDISIVYQRTEDGVRISNPRNSDDTRTTTITNSGSGDSVIVHDPGVRETTVTPGSDEGDTGETGTGGHVIVHDPGVGETTTSGDDDDDTGETGTGGHVIVHDPGAGETTVTPDSGGGGTSEGGSGGTSEGGSSGTSEGESSGSSEGGSSGTSEGGSSGTSEGGSSGSSGSGGSSGSSGSGGGSSVTTIRDIIIVEEPPIIRNRVIYTPIWTCPVDLAPEKPVVIAPPRPITNVTITRNTTIIIVELPDKDDEIDISNTSTVNEDVTVPGELYYKEEVMDRGMPLDLINQKTCTLLEADPDSNCGKFIGRQFFLFQESIVCNPGLGMNGSTATVTFQYEHSKLGYTMSFRNTTTGEVEHCSAPPLVSMPQCKVVKINYATQTASYDSAYTGYCGSLPDVSILPEKWYKGMIGK